MSKLRKYWIAVTITISVLGGVIGYASHLQAVWGMPETSQEADEKIMEEIEEVEEAQSEKWEGMYEQQTKTSATLESFMQAQQLYNEILLANLARDNERDV